MAGIILTGADLPEDENEFTARFVGKTAEQLIETFNRERKKQGGVSARGRFRLQCSTAPPSSAKMGCRSAIQFAFEEILLF